jgi:60 kDa SS-A/Ro ribonucleoprotein
MSKALLNAIKTEKVTPQTTRARADQVRNSAGGFVFQVSDKDRLERFLILGTDGGTYYASEKKVTDQNIEFLRKMIRENERLVVDTVLDVSTNNRAYRQSPALFALALVLSEGKDKAYARDAFNKIVRTATHLYEVAEYIDNLGGWGRSKRTAFSGWFEEKSADSLAYQAVKYRQRNGWTLKDVLRLSHSQPDEDVAHFILGKPVTGDGQPVILRGFAEIQRAGSVEEVVKTLDAFKNLPWETIPTQFLTDARVWKALFHNGQLKGQALIRNITRLAKNGAFDDLQFAGDVAKALSDQEMIAKTRLHPINFLNALGVYRNGAIQNTGGWHVTRKKDWTTNAKILGALEAGFQASFGNVQPSNKRTQLAIDTSGSMTWWGPAGLVGMDCRQAAGAMAMITARTEPYVEVIGFGTNTQAVELSDTDSLDTVQKKIDGLWAGGTNLALPMTEAKRNKREFDVFVEYTDNETWAGSPHPFQALKDYRQSSGIDARLAVVGMTSTGFSIADPNDAGSMDFVGFDASAPRVLADFAAGRL